MKLWVLEAIEDSSYFDPWYDKMFQVVVRAPTEKEARGLASQHTGDEGKKP